MSATTSPRAAGSGPRWSCRPPDRRPRRPPGRKGRRHRVRAHGRAGLSSRFATALVSGLGGLAGQIGGDTGRWISAIEQRIAHPDGPETGMISFGAVSRIGEHVEVSTPREQLDSNRAEHWARDVIIDKIPGARHETD